MFNIRYYHYLVVRTMELELKTTQEARPPRKYDHTGNKTTPESTPSFGRPQNVTHWCYIASGSSRPPQAETTLALTVGELP